MSLVRADGFCVIPQNSEGIEAGETAHIELCRPLGEIERTLVSIGSHDLILDVIADMMTDSSAFLASAHAGNMAGLMALKRGECHIAPIHLLDEASGEYNRPYIQRLFPDTPMALVRGVGRIQGLIVQKGNPLGIKSVADIADNRCRYINRQRGAGTRLFLDCKLKQAGITGASINGYEREAATHMAATAAIQSGSADTGMGIAAAARTLNLDFIPLGQEEYSFALPSRFLELPQFEAFLKTLRAPAFHQRLAEFGGYTWEGCGEVLVP